MSVGQSGLTFALNQSIKKLKCGGDGGGTPKIKFKIPICLKENLS